MHKILVLILYMDMCFKMIVVGLVKEEILPTSPWPIW